MSLIAIRVYSYGVFARIPYLLAYVEAIGTQLLCREIGTLTT